MQEWVQRSGKDHHWLQHFRPSFRKPLQGLQSNAENVHLSTASMVSVHPPYAGDVLSLADMQGMPALPAHVGPYIFAVLFSGCLYM